MRSSAPNTWKARTAGSLWAESSRRLLLIAAAFIVCISALSYLVGLQAATCRLNVFVHKPTASGPPAQASILQPTTNQPLGPGSLAPLGRHILLEYYKIPGHLFAPLTDTHALQGTFRTLIQQAGMTYLGHSCHVFTGSDAVTCVFLLSESHLSIHTWPEHSYAALDVFTCGASAHPEVIEQGLQELLQPGLVVRAEQARGGLDLRKLTPQQHSAKVLHTFTVNTEIGEGSQQLLHQVPVLNSSTSRYQTFKVVDVAGQLGRCLLLDGIIQFCSYDLDGYTDHMARYPLQLLQALHGCGPEGSLGTGPGTAAAPESDTLLIAKPQLPPAASSSTPGHVTCRASLLQLPAAAKARNATATDACQKLQQRKLRVLLVGGGDGWVAGHLISCYGDLVETVTAVELDMAVSNVTERYFGHIMSHGSPFKNPRITWRYSDAYEWVMQRVAQCRSTSDAAASAASSVSSTAAATAAPAAAELDTPVGATAVERRLRRSSAATLRDHTHPVRTKDGSNIGAMTSTLDCAGFDAVIIDSTDFTVKAASKLHSAPFYSALYQLMNSRAALIQIIDNFLRAYGPKISSIEGALHDGGWVGVGRSTVYTPSYGGESLMMHAVKR